MIGEFFSRRFKLPSRNNIFLYCMSKMHPDQDRDYYMQSIPARHMFPKDIPYLFLSLSQFFQDLQNIFDEYVKISHALEEEASRAPFMRFASQSTLLSAAYQK